MNSEDFEKVINDIQNRISNTLVVKGKEYAVSNEDRLHNFNVGAEITKQSRERVLDGFLLKHYISYRDMLNSIDNGKLPTIEYLEEKIGDMLVYLMLFEASIKDKISKQK